MGTLFARQRIASRRAGPALRRGVLAVAGTAALAGCATGPRMEAQWSDPQLPPGLLHGAKVLVACEAYEPVVKQLCIDQMKSQLVARGATPISAEEVASSTPGRPVAEDQLLATAHAAGAKAIWATTMQIGEASVPSSSGVSFGVGGFGGGYHSGGSVGVGVSVPVGGSHSVNGYVANGKLMDGTGRMLWTGKASTPPSSDVNAQVGELARTLMESAGKSGLF